MPFIYHITQRSAWKAAQRTGWYQTDSLTEEGFIHCSAKDQVAQVANAFYQGVPDLVVLFIDEELVEAEIRYEAPAHPLSTNALSDEPLFPHIYGQLNLDAVNWVIPLEPDEKGRYSFKGGDD